MIYFIQNDRGGAIKIGYSKSIEGVNKRMKSMQTGTPTELLLLGTIGGGRKDEYNFHRKFYTYQIHGEWFQPDPILINFISNLFESNGLSNSVFNLEALKGKTLDDILADLEKQYIKITLKKTKGNQTSASKILRITIRSLRHRIKKYKIKVVV